MDPFKEKYFGFFISGGRTGTKFFGDLLSGYITNSFSIHEPDVMHLKKGETPVSYGIKHFGLYWMVFGKLLGKTGIRNLSDLYLSGKYSLNAIQTALVKYRKLYYQKIPRNLIIESYSGWYGLIPAIRTTYANYKIIVIIRDPRDWVRSNMDWGKMYGHRDWISKLGFKRLSPVMIHDTQYLDQWSHFDQFQKLCWAWKTIYEILISYGSTDPNVKIIKFEDLFYSNQKEQTLNSLLEFMSRFNNTQFEYDPKINYENILGKKIHRNIAYNYPDWPRWPDHRAQTLDRICGDLMENFGYGNERAWREKLTQLP